MKSTAKFLLTPILITLFLFGVLAKTQAGEGAPLHSSYAAHGKNPDGTDFDGTVTFKKVPNQEFDLYEIQWKMGDSVYGGIGLRTVPGVITASFIQEGQPGLATYSLEPDGSLQGVYWVKGDKGPGLEVLKPN